MEITKYKEIESNNIGGYKVKIEMSDDEIYNIVFELKKEGGKMFIPVDTYVEAKKYEDKYNLTHLLSGNIDSDGNLVLMYFSD